MSYKITAGRAATAFEVSEAMRLNLLAERQLASVRLAAEKWRNGVGIATSVSGAITLLAAPDVLAGASARATVDGAWLLGIGALLGLVSLALAMRAAFGWPTSALFAAPDSLRAWEKAELVRTVRALRVSMVVSVAALVILGISVAVLVFGVPFLWAFPGWLKVL